MSWIEMMDELVVAVETGVVPLDLDGQAAFTVGMYQDPDGWQGWVVIDYRLSGPGEVYRHETAFEAVMTLQHLIGTRGDLRRVVGPLVSRFRFARLFPLGSSLGWIAVPLGDFTGRPLGERARAPRPTPLSVSAA